MKYQSELIKEIVEARGHEKSSIHYESECVESWIEETKGAYPKLCDYQSEWLNYINENPIGNFPYEIITDVTEATVNNVVPYAYGSAILKGSTKYRDIDTGDILDTFDETKNLELVSVKMPVLTTTGKNLFDMNNTHFISGLIHNSNLTINANANINTYYIPCEPNTSYTITKGLTSYFRICETADVPTTGCKVNNLVNNPSKTSLSITTSESAKYICFNIHNKSTDTVSENEILGTVQIEKGLVPTSYEPYKSSILTVNEEVELRGIGDVKDELNLLTGKLTQRIDEDGEVLTQEVVKTVDLTVTDQDGNTKPIIRPIEGTMHLMTEGDTIKPLFSGEIPVEATTQNLASFIKEE